MASSKPVALPAQTLVDITTAFPMANGVTYAVSVDAEQQTPAFYVEIETTDPDPTFPLVGHPILPVSGKGPGESGQQGSVRGIKQRTDHKFWFWAHKSTAIVISEAAGV